MQYTTIHPDVIFSESRLAIVSRSLSIVSEDEQRDNG